MLHSGVQLRCPHCAAFLPDGSVPPQQICGTCRKEFDLYLIERPYESLAAQPALNPGAPLPNSLSNTPFVPAAPPIQPPPATPPALPPIPVVPPVVSSSTAAEGRAHAQPLSPISPHPPSPQQIAASPCANHPGNQAVSACTHCRRCLCNLCATPIEGSTYCPHCFEGLRSSGNLALSQRAFGTPRTVFNLGLATIFLGWLTCIGLITGPMGLYLGYRGLEEIKQRPGLPGRSKIVTGMILNAVGMGLTVIFYGILMSLGLLDELG